MQPAAKVATGRFRSVLKTAAEIAEVVHTATKKTQEVIELGRTIWEANSFSA